jgi:hypothetical protein
VVSCDLGQTTFRGIATFWSDASSFLLRLTFPAFLELVANFWGDWAAFWVERRGDWVYMVVIIIFSIA